MKLRLPSVTLICVDGTPRWRLAERAMQASMECCDFGATKLIRPPLNSLEAYSKFMVFELHKHFDTTHALVVQSDGYVLNPEAWTNEFLRWDYSGSPWLPSGTVGNGGFSLRSKRLCQLLANCSHPEIHPEDSLICGRYRSELERQGILFAPREVAEKFAFEGRAWSGQEWSGVPTHYNGQFGFHSWLTPLPAHIPKPYIFHHTGDYGDVIYGLAVMKALGGGVLFLSADNRYPYPYTTRAVRTGSFGATWVDNIKPLIMDQEYVWNCLYTHGTPYSTSHDLNKFREPWKNRTAKDTESILNLHFDAFGMKFDGKPWLRCQHPIVNEKFPIIVNLTQRYRDDVFPWYELVQNYHDKMLFVGTEQEHELFQGFAVPHRVPWQPTRNLHELARVIAGCKLFIGNQSAALAIAIGLGKKVITCEWRANPNCRVRVEGAYYSNSPKSDHIAAILNG